ncbi:hypothetical protein ACFQHV_22655 [Promicromonospora thailandica]|uniref:Uncharacterized protein n=1 Tax=Promicromonospora thailandica TaxID=765201 RepID=A0A9X2G1A7_9MICO|nr:hypothetical protein [Promicromonospora thailandica]MCP2263427.1 hypothetical protein [Promicromonospora thailandica]BFF19409.1 hypothetical protein GCM10025730_29300 [Promicromonospora thailandica]
MSETYEAAAPARPSRWTGTWPTNTAWLVLGAFTGVALLVGGTATAGGTWQDAVAEDPATTVGVAALCYLTAAVTGVRWTAWLVAFAAAAVPVASELLDTPRWIGFALVGAVLTLIGLARGRRATWPQAAALVGYLGVATVALYLEPRLGLALAGLALAAHAVWDVVHYRRDVVVNRSLAVWCVGLDLTMGGICVALALAG